ncbi:MAG TPA: hypothetical protein VMM60_02655 [Ilumatobacter sp.]|nr:hypothetical protein [Ilumatobacter sp.]
MNTHNSQRTLRGFAVPLSVLGLVAFGAACSGDDLAESIVERQIEAETGDDVDFQINDGGMTFESEEGSMTVDADGNMIIESPEGSILVNADGDGNVEMIGEDGESTYTATAGGDLPDEFPTDIAIPGGFILLDSSVMGDATMSLVTVAFGTNDSVDDAGTAITASLEAAGYERQQFVDQDSMLYITYLRGEETVTVTVADEPSGSGQDNVVSMVVQLVP